MDGVLLKVFCFGMLKSSIAFQLGTGVRDMKKGHCARSMGLGRLSEGFFDAICACHILFVIIICTLQRGTDVTFAGRHRSLWRYRRHCVGVSAMYGTLKSHNAKLEGYSPCTIPPISLLFRAVLKTSPSKPVLKRFKTFSEITRF